MICIFVQAVNKYFVTAAKDLFMCIIVHHYNYSCYTVLSIIHVNTPVKNALQ